MKTLSEIFAEYKAACDMPTKPDWIKKLPTSHIEDENMSVKWNREFVEQNNRDFLEAVSDTQRKRSLAMNAAQAKIVKFIQKEAKTGEKGAKAIFDMAFREGHACGLNDVKIWIEDLIDLVQECNEK